MTPTERKIAPLTRHCGSGMMVLWLLCVSLVLGGVRPSCGPRRGSRVCGSVFPRHRRRCACLMSPGRGKAGGILAPTPRRPSLVCRDHYSPGRCLVAGFWSRRQWAVKNAPRRGFPRVLVPSVEIASRRDLVLRSPMSVARCSRILRATNWGGPCWNGMHWPLCLDCRSATGSHACSTASASARRTSGSARLNNNPNRKRRTSSRKPSSRPRTTSIRSARSSTARRSRRAASCASRNAGSTSARTAWRRSTRPCSRRNARLEHSQAQAHANARPSSRSAARRSRRWSSSRRRSCTRSAA